MSASREREKEIVKRQARQARQHTHRKHLPWREATVLLRVVRALALARVLTSAVRTHVECRVTEGKRNRKRERAREREKERKRGGKKGDI